MERVLEYVMEPASGYALIIRKGHHLRVTDIEGQQVVDMAVFNNDNYREKLSTAYSRTRYRPKPGTAWYPRDKVTEGDTLMSTICRPLMTIITETPEPKGIHGMHSRSCNRFFYEANGIEGRDGCLEIIGKAVAAYGILPEDIPDTMDLFMNYQHSSEEGRWKLYPPVSKAGDYIEFRAEMDCLVGLSNCPESDITDCNAGHCTPMKVEVFQ